MKGFKELDRTRINDNEDWLTPPEIIDQLGQIDLDPCASMLKPNHVNPGRYYTKQDDGLLQPWFGRVFMNPPYGTRLSQWLEKMSLHNNGIALIFARTDTKAFQNYVFSHAHSILFLNKRITFLKQQGDEIKPAKFNAGAPSCLAAWGQQCSLTLINCKIPGKFVQLKNFIKHS